MIILYTPEGGGEPEQFDTRTLKVSEVSIVQRTIDQKWEQVKEGLHDEDPEAMRGVAWVLKKRTNPALRFGEFDPGVEELAIRLDKREVVDQATVIQSAIDSNPDATAMQIEWSWQALRNAAADKEHVEAVIREHADAADEGDEGKEAAAADEPEPPADVQSPQAESGNSIPTLTPFEPSTSGSSPTSATSLPQPLTL